MNENGNDDGALIMAAQLVRTSSAQILTMR
jgi:hypothetical protein